MARSPFRMQLSSWRNRPQPTVKESLADADAKVEAMNKLGDVAVALESADGTVRHSYCSEAMETDSRFAAESVSKLFTHAIIFRLIDEGRLKYHSSVASRMPSGSLDGLHVVGGADYGADITVRHLLDQTSGLPSWEDSRDPGGRTVVEQIVDWDRVVHVDEQMEISAAIGAKFPPGGSDRRAHYSDLNAELLSQVAQHTTGQSFQELAYEYILVPLGMELTTFVVPATRDYAPFRTHKEPVWASRYLSSSPGSAGVISTAQDLLTFIRAFHTGKLFNPRHLVNPELRRIQYWPLRYGAGMMAVPHNRRLPLGPKKQLMLGHSGVTGAFAFYSPDEDVFIAGSINSILTSPFDVIDRYLRVL
ncbi:D-alanyl-D-alanine carboxypeptidase precursor [Corynebacterium atrinae]|uniref:serine hydrolase domain-containing protein n=1 Tax=Corynebacterium atrinae TaxID=1336740 RepID=UPI0025B47C5A|nr:serine hydrolase domain-containing protein [Corynebacterium atrinae]WJY63072.1 D-alanyl-D-alanine carboxypeptidase precursor [Corynebacterium atrinae]